MATGRLHLSPREFFEPGDQRERHCEASEGPGAEEQDALVFRLRRYRSLRPGMRRRFVIRQDPRPLADAQYVKDERDPSIPHDGGAGIQGEPLQLLAQRLHHNFLGIVDAIHNQAELAVFGLQYHHADGIAVAGNLQAQYLVQVGDGQKTSAAPENRLPMTRMLSEVRSATRGLVKWRGSAVAVLTLAIGIGTATAVSVLLRVLLADPSRAMVDNNRFLALARRLTSCIDLRAMSPDYPASAGAFIIADDKALVYRLQADRWDGISDMNDPAVVRRYLNFFDEVWQTSMQESQMRQMLM